MRPLVTVIIPTANRPHLLPRAVASALTGLEAGDAEIIVVPNGPDQSWRKSLRVFSGSPAVRVTPIALGNANAARNHGLSLARGKYVRFLDDDDFLYPDGALEQYHVIDNCGADICSSPVCLVDHDGQLFGTWDQPETDDFISGALGARRMLQVTAHVFKTQSIQQVLWDERLAYSQDIDWMLRLCAYRDYAWIKTKQPAGAWLRHIDDRISTNAPLHARKVIVSGMLMNLCQTLLTQGRFTDARRESAALGLWECVHAAFFLHPVYWARIAREAKRLFPESQPDIPLYNHWLIRKMGLCPLFWESVIAPKRMVEYATRRTLFSLRLLRRW